MATVVINNDYDISLADALIELDFDLRRPDGNNADLRGKVTAVLDLTNPGWDRSRLDGVDVRVAAEKTLRRHLV